MCFRDPLTRDRVSVCLDPTMVSGQIEHDFGETSDVLTIKHDTTDTIYFQSQTTVYVNFPWLPEVEEILVSSMSTKSVESTLPTNGFGVPDIYVDQCDKEVDTDRLFLDSDGDYGQETCED